MALDDFSSLLVQQQQFQSPKNFRKIGFKKFRKIDLKNFRKIDFKKFRKIDLKNFRKIDLKHFRKIDLKLIIHSNQLQMNGLLLGQLYRRTVIEMKEGPK